MKLAGKPLQKRGIKEKKIKKQWNLERGEDREGAEVQH